MILVTLIPIISSIDTRAEPRRTKQKLTVEKNSGIDDLVSIWGAPRGFSCYCFAPEAAQTFVLEDNLQRWHPSIRILFGDW
jgi:hypothetical protein